jgi:hypothetical protein
MATPDAIRASPTNPRRFRMEMSNADNELFEEELDLVVGGLVPWDDTWVTVEAAPAPAAVDPPIPPQT